jgi:hypothetical protein
MYRYEFRAACAECGATGGHGNNIEEQFCVDCGVLRTGPGRFLDLPEAFSYVPQAPSYATNAAPVENDETRQWRWEQEKYERRNQWSLQLLASLKSIGAVQLEKHPLGNRFCGWGCQDQLWLAAATRTRNGVLIGRVHCGGCGRLTPSHSISHKLLDPDGLPVLNDRACSICAGRGCPKCSCRCAEANCDSFETELHHILPWHIATPNGLNANNWPTVFLCRPHHKEWHDLVTPNMNKRATAA